MRSGHRWLEFCSQKPICRKRMAIHCALGFDAVQEKRHSVALQQKGSGAGAMAIGEFGGAAAATGGHGPMYAAPAYWLYEMSQAALNPARAFADAGRLFFKNPANPWSHTQMRKTVAAACVLFERSTRRYGKPEWNIDSTPIS